MSNKYYKFYAGAFVLGVVLYVGMLMTFLPPAKAKYTPWLALWICLAPAILLLPLKPFVNRNSDQVHKSIQLIDSKVQRRFADQALFLSRTDGYEKRMLNKYVALQLLWGVFSAYVISFFVSALLVFFKII